jgi:hypothetical protein
MSFKGMIAFAALACMAMVATPSIAASSAHVFSAPAKSGELCPATVASVATANTAQAVNDRTGDERAPVQPGMYAATLIVGFGFAAAPGAPAPFDPGRMSIA